VEGEYLEIYYFMLLFWFVSYFGIRVVGRGKKDDGIRWKKAYAFITGITLALLMGLRHYSVGSDTVQYMYRYNNFPVDFTLGTFMGEETLFYALSTMLKNLGIGYQAYLAFIALIISVSFSYFYYKYSKNIFLSFFLHVTIGLFSVTMSATRQTIAISIILFAFDAIINQKFFRFTILVLIASLFHTSAIFFLPIYLLRNIKITKKIGLVFLFSTIAILLVRIPVSKLFQYIVPMRYLKYGIVSEANPINPLLVVIAVLIPFVSLIFWNINEKSSEKEFKLMSLLILISIVNVIVNIMALNSSMIARMTFYLIPFSMVLIPNIIEGIRDKGLKLIAVYAAILLPLIQFIISTPEGTLIIDNYKFFWQ